MRRYLRLAVLCLACGFCSLLYAFSQLALSPEEGAGGGGGGGKPQARVASWLAGGGRGAARGAGSAATAAHPGGTHRYGSGLAWRVGGERAPGAGVGLSGSARGAVPRRPLPGRGLRPPFPPFPLHLGGGVPGAAPA